MRVREATKADRQSVYDVHTDSVAGLGPAAYSDEQVAAWNAGGDPSNYPVDGETNYFVVAESAGEVVGFGEFDTETGEYLTSDPDAEVKAVYVHPDAARQGVGSALLSHLEAEAAERGLDSFGLCASLNAVAFYERHGYERVGEQPHEFSGGVEGTVMEMSADL